MTVLVLALAPITSVDAADITGLAGSNGSNASAGTPGTGGDGGGTSGSGAAGQASGAAGVGVAGSSGTAGGGGGGGRDLVVVSSVTYQANGGAGGTGEFGTGGAGGTVTSAAGGGHEEAGGGGGFGASGSGSSGGGGGGGGGRGLTITTSSGTIDLGDTVTGGAGGKGGSGNGNKYADGGGGGGGGIGIVFGGTGLLTVSGTISGGAGGQGGDGATGNGSYGGSGGYGGTGLRVSSSGATVFVDGTITGGNGGNRGASGYVPTKSTPGAGGTGIVGADLSVILGADGTISGGLSGDGTTRADAVIFTSGANSFALEADTGTVIGKVRANGTDDVFRLAGTSTGNVFDTTLLGDQFVDFERFEKTGSGSWLLNGSPGTATSWSVTEGTLSLASAMTTDIETSGTGTFQLDGGSLDGTLVNAGHTIAQGSITGAVSNEAAGTLALSGDLAIGGTLTSAGLITAFGDLAPASFAVAGNGGVTSSGVISLHQEAGLAGDRLDLSAAGTFTSQPGSTLRLDIDLSGLGTPTADQLLLGATSGQIDVQFNPDPSLYGAVGPDLLVIATADGALTATASGLQHRGLVSYALKEIGTDWYVTSALDVAPLGGLVSTLAGPSAIIDQVTRPSALSAADTPAACAPGLTANLSGGHQPIEATTTGSSGASASEADLRYGGVSVDLSAGCQRLASADGVSRLGLVASVLSGESESVAAFSGDETLASTTRFDAFYAGLYGQFTADRWVADLSAGYDLTRFDLSAARSGLGTALIDNQSPLAQRLSARALLGYRYEAGEVTLTPALGLSLSQSHIETINLSDLGAQLAFTDRFGASLSGGLEIATRHAVAETGGAFRSFASGTIIADLGAGQAVTYRDDANQPVAFETTAHRLRGVLAAGIDYTPPATTGGQATLGLRADLSATGTNLGTGVSVKAGVSF